MVRDLWFFLFFIFVDLCILRICWIDLPRSRIYSEKRDHRLEKKNSLNSHSKTRMVCECHLAVRLGQVGWMMDSSPQGPQHWGGPAADIWQKVKGRGSDHEERLSSGMDCNRGFQIVFPFLLLPHTAARAVLKGCSWDHVTILLIILQSELVQNL